jgi:hypothetical protein
LHGEARLAHDARAGAVAEMGFVGIDDLGAHAIAARYFPDTEPSTRGHGGHILHASTRRM